MTTSNMLTRMIEDDLKGRWAIVLGGSRGHGKECIRLLNAQGVNVVTLYAEPPEDEDQTCLNDFKKWSEQSGVAIHNKNGDAYSDREKMVEFLKEKLPEGNHYSFLLHAIAWARPYPIAENEGSTIPSDSWDAISDSFKEAGIDISSEDVGKAMENAFFEKKAYALGKAVPRRGLEKKPVGTKKDIEFSIDKMGTDVLGWVQTLHEEELLDEDFTRIVGLTAEGNKKAISPEYAPAGAAKAVMENLFMNMASQWGARHSEELGYRFSIVQAGVTDTRAMNGIGGADHMLAEAHMRTCAFGITTPEKVQAIMVFLASRFSEHMTGGDPIYIDGGEHIN